MNDNYLESEFEKNPVEYGIKLVIKSIMSSIPGISSIGTVWSELENVSQIKRFNAFANDVSKKINELSFSTKELGIELGLLKNIIESVRYERRYDNIDFYSISLLN